MKNLTLPLFFLLFGYGISFSQNVPAYVPTNGLVGWWPFSGNAIDSSGNGNNGTVNGATLTTDRFGVAGKAYLFSGLNDVISIPNNSILNFQTNNIITVSFWLKSDSNQLFRTPIIQKQTGDGTTQIGYNIGLDNNGNLSYSVMSICAKNGTTNPAGFSASKINAQFINSPWRHVVLIYNQGVGTCYVNGILDTVLLGQTGILGSNTNPLLFGSASNLSSTSKKYFGKLDDIGIWNRALTCQEVQRLYSGQAVYQQPQLAAIQGPNSVVSGSNITLTNATPGGVWTSSNTTVATINSSGVVTALALGRDTIRYTISDACGSYSTSYVITVTSACLPNHVPTNGLVGYWPFCGNANDESGNGNNGIVNGATLTTDRFGVANRAYSFDGVNDNIITNYNFPSGSLPKSFSVWTKMNNINDRGWLIGNNLNCSTPGSIGTFGLFLDGNSSKLLFQGNSVDIDFNHGFTNGLWYNIIVTYDGATVNCYLNGVLNRSLVTLLNTQSIHALFGSRTDTLNPGCPEEYFTGQLDDIGIWNRALTQQEITNLYNGYIPQNNFITGIDTICRGDSTNLSITYFTSTINYNGYYGYLNNTPVNINLNQWNYIAVTRDNNLNGKIYVNGNLSYSGLFANTMYIYDALDLGAVNYFGYGGFFKGKIDEVRISNRVRTSTEILSHFNLNQPFTSDANTIGLWHFDQLNGNTVNATNGINGNITNCLWTSGRFGNCLEYDGISSRVNFPMSFPVTNYSAEFWFFPTRASGVVTSFWRHNTTSFVIDSTIIYPQYLWSNGATTATINVNPTITTNYTCTVTQNGQTHVDTFTVNVLSTPNVNAGTDRTVFSGTSQTLNATGAQSYSWSNGVQQGVSFIVNTTTTYTVTGTDNNGCSATDQITITVLPFTGIQSSADTICAGDSVVLNMATTTSIVNNCNSLPGTLSNGLVGYWPFCGNANDISGNANHGIVNGASLTTDRFGNLNSAYSFNPNIVSDISCSIDSNLRPPFTVSIWVEPGRAITIANETNDCNYSSSYGMYQNTQNWALHPPNAGNLNLFVGLSVGTNSIQVGEHAEYVLTSRMTHQRNTTQFSNVTFSYRTDSSFLYVNGNLVRSRSIACTNNPKFLYSTLLFGSQYPGQSNFSGKLDDIGVWRRTLNNSEILQIYNQTNTTIQYLWSNGATTSSISVNPTTSTNYTCTITYNGQTHIDTLRVTVLQQTTSTITQSACTSFTLNGQTYNQSGTYTQVRSNAAGCDSTITLNLTIRQPSTSIITQSACSSFTLNGQTYNQSGTYTQVRTNAAGCDSTITLNLTIRQPTTSSITQSACSSFTLNGQTYNQSGTYTQIRTNAAGCDSTITLNLTIRQPTTSTISQLACTSFTLNGQTYNQSGTFTQVRTNAAGCDSTITLNLTIRQPTSSSLTQSACSSFTLNGQTYNQSGTFTQVRTNAAGCDSTITLNLTIRQPTTSTITQSACSSFTLNGQTYNQSGTFTQVRTNAAGCDSTITLNLTIGQPNQRSIRVRTCGPYTANGQTYTQSGNYVQTLQNQSGCDSTLRIQLTIQPFTYSSVNASACGSYTFGGQTFSSSGVYTINQPNPNGCNTITTLRLTINQPSSSSITQTACQSYILNGQTYIQSGIYTQTLRNTVGCDSIITLNLTIIPKPIVSISNDTAICAGRSVALLASGGQNFSWSPGSSLSSATVANPLASPLSTTIYSVTVSSQGGCTATNQVTVTVNPNPQVTANSATICQGQSATLNAQGASNYSWSPAVELNSTIGSTVIANPLKTRFYQVVGTDQNGCIGIANVTVTVNSRPYVFLGRDQLVCVGTPVLLDAGINGTIYQWSNGETTRTINVSSPGQYAVTVSTSSACAGSDTVNISYRRCRYNDPTILPVKSGDLNDNPKNISTDIANKTIRVYPNPADDFIIIENDFLEDNDTYIIKIYNQLGQAIFTKVLTASKQEIDLSEWAVPGLYLMEIMDSSGTLLEQKKIVIQK